MTLLQFRNNKPNGQIQIPKSYDPNWSPGPPLTSWMTPGKLVSLGLGFSYEKNRDENNTCLIEMVREKNGIIHGEPLCMLPGVQCTL